MSFALKIDAHQHYWHPARGDYGWMSPDLPIARPYGPADLGRHLVEHEIDGTILVQAAPSVAETEYLLGIADTHDSVYGVVGWVNFEDPAAKAEIKRLAAHPKLKGLRPMIQDIAEDGWMLREDIRWAYEAMIETGLVFDLLGQPRHLGQALELVRRYPDLPIVLDHGMKPNIAAGARDIWADGMARLADTGVYCKLSGLVTEAGEGWDVARLSPYIEHLVSTFGADRLIWGSDWPVMTLASDYHRWHDIADAAITPLGANGHAAVFGGNARRFYGI